MGLNLNSAYMLAHCVKDREMSGRCLTLGRQRVPLTMQDVVKMLVHLDMAEIGANNAVRLKTENQIAALSDLTAKGRHLSPYMALRDKGCVSDELFFRLIGFDEIKSLDISDFELADFLFDLNQPGILEVIGEPFDYVVELGTMEHVFHIPNVLRNMFEATKVGGFITHCTPSNNFMNHGFYQLSPTFFDDYYRANGFEIHRLQVLRDTVRDGQFVDDEHEIVEYDPGIMGMNSPLDGKVYSVHALVGKTAASTFNRIPQQSEYAKKWEEGGKGTALDQGQP